MNKFRLYHYWRSSSSWRVRWALALKKIPCEYVSVNLLSDETDGPEQRARNPFGYVPVLQILDDSGDTTGKPVYLTESLAIIEWLEELVGTPSVLPGSSYQKAKIRQLAETINAGTQPIQNPAVAQFYSSDAEQQKKWSLHWIRNGLAAYESLVQETPGVFSVGDTLTLADLCLIPQCYNALRQGVFLSEFPKIEKIYQSALLTESCQASAPDSFSPQS
ncbi:MAG: maleylacetoacetate isomerase [Bdellovibrionia bacterium]